MLSIYFKLPRQDGSQSESTLIYMLLRHQITDWFHNFIRIFTAPLQMDTIPDLKLVSSFSVSVFKSDRQMISNKMHIKTLAF